MARLRLCLTSKSRRWLAGIATVAAVTGCQDPAEPDQSLLPADQLFWSLTINHKAVNLAMVQPYDTIHLSAIPRNVHGDILPDAPAATFAPSTDLAIVISSDGLVKARSQTSTTGLRAVATLTYNGITRVDTAFIVVTNTPSPLTMDRFTIAPPPGDSTITAASDAFLDRRNKRLQITARSGATTIPRVIAFFESSNQGLATVNRQNGLTSFLIKPGTVVVRASAMVYGVEKKDSVIFTVTHPLLGVVMFKAGKLESDVTIQRGGDVLWFNATPDSLDLVFDDSLAVQRPSGSTFIGLGYGDAAGNIPLFAGDPAVQLTAIDPNVVRTRSFPVPGVYRYTSRRNPKVRGTIHVQ